MDINFFEALQALGSASPLVTILILWKVGLIGNGKNKRDLGHEEEPEESPLLILKELKSNHLHEIKEILERIDGKLEKHTEHLIWIKSRINGKQDY